MRCFVRLLLILLMLSMLFSCSKDEEIPETEMVAKVNSTPVMRLDYEKNLQALVKRYIDTHPYAKMKQDEFEEAKKLALRQTIERELLYQEALRRNYRLTQAEIENQLQRIRQRFPNEEEFNRFIQSSGKSLNEFIRDVVQKDLLINKLIMTEVTNRIMITPSELELAYQEAKDAPEMVRASHIVFVVREDDSPDMVEEKKKKLEEIRERALKGEDFAQLAREFSQGPAAPNGGDVGFFAYDDMVPPFSEAAFSLDVGELSEVIKTRYGFHLIKVTDKKEPHTVPFQEIKGELEEELRRNKGNELTKTLIDRLRAQAQIELIIPQIGPGQSPPAVAPQQVAPQQAAPHYIPPQQAPARQPPAAVRPGPE